jgi:hypothetical protein
LRLFKNKFYFPKKKKEDNKNDFGHVQILIGCKTPKELLFREETPEWMKRSEIRINCTVDKDDLLAVSHSGGTNATQRNIALTISGIGQVNTARRNVRIVAASTVSLILFSVILLVIFNRRAEIHGLQPVDFDRSNPRISNFK